MNARLFDLRLPQSSHDSEIIYLLKLVSAVFRMGFSLAKVRHFLLLKHTISIFLFFA